MTALDSDTFVDVDLDKPIACIHERCVSPATWRARNVCDAHHSILVCDRHRETESAFHERNCDNVACKFCDQLLPHPHADWTKL